MVLDKKAQIEMMGLTVIVVLVSVGLLFFISFKLTPQDVQPAPKQQYSEKQLATNYIQAALKTTTGCKDLNLQEILQDCALYKELDCLVEDSCFHVNLTLNNITNGSLDVWKQPYHFKIEHGNEILYNKSKRGCNKFMPSEATGFQPITLYPDDKKPILVTLRVCKQ